MCRRSRTHGWKNGSSSPLSCSSPLSSWSNRDLIEPCTVPKPKPKVGAVQALMPRRVGDGASTRLGQCVNGGLRGAAEKKLMDPI